MDYLPTRTSQPKTPYLIKLLAAFAAMYPLTSNVVNAKGEEGSEHKTVQNIPKDSTLSLPPTVGNEKENRRFQAVVNILFKSQNKGNPVLIDLDRYTIYRLSALICDEIENSKTKNRIPSNIEIVITENNVLGLLTPETILKATQ